MSYNGWTNYETWNASLWMDGDTFWHERGEELMQEHNNDADDAKYALSKEMEDYYEECKPEAAGMYADLLSASMSRINWYEIAGHYIEDVEVDAPDEIEE